ncbi:MAG: amino acid adenylation domain-containing protein, partial [Rhodobacteraceae bacterium]|nr:amino acid adenylation domain-containing protein [Paracoccaceae bacterium]
MHAGEGADRTLGPCINTLPIRIPLGRAPVKDAIRNTQTLLARVMRHEHAPLSLVQRCSSVPPTVPVFNSILNYRRPTRGEGRVEFAQIAGRPHSDTVVTQVGVTDSDWFSTNIPGREFITFVERTNYPLTLSVDDFGDGLRLVAQVQSPIDPAQVCGYMTQALTEIVTALEAAPDRPLSELNVLGAAEREKLVEAWNDTARDYPRDARVPDLIAAQAAATPERTAVRCGDAALGYGELEALSNRLAHELRARGIGRGDFVGLSVERGVELPALMLGVMKAGAAYVPLDPAFPAERLRFMAEDAELKLLITTGALAAPFALPDGRLLLWDADRAGIDARPGTALPPDPARDAGPLDPAYVIYTSGSTGKPKGVVVPHRAVVNMLSSMAREPGIGADDVLLAVTTLSFDISVLELLLPLTVGATVAVAAREDAADGQALAGLIRRHGATVMQATPVTWRLLLGTGWQAPRPFRALAGGEALPREIAEALIPGVLMNMYGPTETTVWSTCARVTDPAAGITIGRPIANTQVYVLNDSLLPCPVGVAGELCIGGDGVTSGYWKRPDLTAERFIDDPFHPGSGRRLYRTGDSARWREDGTLEHLGRLDFQTKVRGYRIELGEIEAAIMRVPGIAASVVIVREDNPGDQRIVAYMVPKGATEGLAAAVRAELQRGLPDYMVPSAFVLIDALPLTPNAKIDRRALPPPSASDALVTVNAHVAPEGETEEGLARIWQELLGLEKVSVEDDFFELGGHSLLALDMLARVEKRFGIHVPVRAVMEGRTIRRIAQAMGGKLASTLPGGIVRIRPGRTEGALFCMPGLGGVSLQYEPLAAKLHGDRAIYAVEVHDFDGDLSVLQSMQGTAAAIVDRMRQVQPDGPYAVIGYSYGGNLAVEVAAELSRRGLPVDLVCVIDAYVPGAVKTETRWARIGRHLRTLRQLRPKARFDYLKFRVQVRIEPLIGRYLPQSEFQHRLTVAAAHGRRAFQTYVPSRYDGPITLIHATELAEWMEVVDDSGTAGWEGVTGRVDVIDMDCGHFDLLHEPYLSDLAAHVDRLLAGVRRADPGAGTAMPAAAGPVRN